MLIRAVSKNYDSIVVNLRHAPALDNKHPSQQASVVTRLRMRIRIVVNEGLPQPAKKNTLDVN